MGKPTLVVFFFYFLFSRRAMVYIFVDTNVIPY